MALDAPPVGPQVQQAFNIGGWAIDPSSTSGSGIDWVHVYAYPSDSAGNVQGPPVFLGAAGLGYPRTDVDAIYGPQFNNSGYNKLSSGLNDRWYNLVVYAHGAVSQVVIQLNRVVYVKGPLVAMDAPAQGSTQIQPFNVGGWAIDRSATSGSGINWVHVYAYPSDSAGNITGSAIFIGAASLGYYRPDIGSLYGSQFNNSGYNRSATGLLGGYYQIVAYANAPASGWAISVNRLVYATWPY
jgi:hypothetical protein